MKEEYYCSADFRKVINPYCQRHDTVCNSKCMHRYRKWETPEQFKERTGEEWPDNAAVYWCYYKTNKSNKRLPLEGDGWFVDKFYNVKSEMSVEWLSTRKPIIICASTRWGYPPEDWRPE